MKLKGRRNFSERWITGAESVCNSNIRDHAQSDQHECAMDLLKREQAIGSNAPTSSYAPITKVLSTISENNVQAKLIIDQPNFLLVCQMT